MMRSMKYMNDRTCRWCMAPDCAVGHARHVGTWGVDRPYPWLPICKDDLIYLTAASLLPNYEFDNEAIAILLLTP